jgi:hypothetical protein
MIQEAPLSSIAIVAVFGAIVHPRLPDLLSCSRSDASQKHKYFLPLTIAQTPGRGFSPSFASFGLVAGVAQVFALVVWLL